MSATNYDSSARDEFQEAVTLAGYRYEYQQSTRRALRSETNIGGSTRAVVLRNIGDMDLLRDGTPIKTGFLTYLNSTINNLVVPTVSVSAGVASITVDITSTPLVGYKIQYVPVDDSGLPVGPTIEEIIAPSIASYTKYALTNGQIYRVAVAAFDGEGGESDFTAPVTVTPLAAPDTPTNLRGAAGDTIIDLSWNFTADPNVTHFIVYRTTANPAPDVLATVPVASAPNNTYRITGLQNRTQYVLSIGTKNANNTLSATVAGPVTLTPIAVPTAPSTVTIESANNQVTVRWTRSSNDSTAVDSYDVDISVNGLVDASYNILQSATTMEVVYSAAGLNGKVAEGRVRAANAIFTSAYTVSPAIIVKPPPSVTSITSVIAGDGECTVNWNAFDAVTTYVDRLYLITSLGGTTISTIEITDLTSTSRTVSGLTNGTLYSFKLRATNTSSPVPTESTPFSQTPYPDPAAPTNLAAFDGIESVSLTWTASSTPTALLSSYYLYIRNTTDSFDLSRVTISKALTAYTVEGLATNKTYRIELTAANPKNGGTESARAGPATAISYPQLAGAPSIDTVATVGGDQTVSVVWTIGSVDASTDGFNIEVTPSGGSATTLTVSGAGARSYTVTGLTNGTSYTFRVRQKNPVTQGPWSSSVSRTPLPPPPAPTGINATAGIGTVTVSWTQPLVTTFIGNYELQMYQSGVAQGSPYVFSVGQTTRTFTVSAAEITNGLEYYFKIKSVNLWYSSAEIQSVTVTPLAKPAAIQGFAVDASDARVIVKWDAISVGERVNTERFRIAYDVTGAVPFTRELVVTSNTAVTVDISGLTNQTSYSFRMRGENSLSGGNGDYTSTLDRTPRSRPSNPTAVTIGAGSTPTPGTATIQWTQTDASGVIDNYEIVAVPVSGGSGPVTVTTGSLQNGFYIISGLENGVEYRATVRAYNALFTSGTVQSSNTFTPLDYPPTVAGLTVDQSSNLLIVSWTASAAAASTAVAGYDIQYNGQQVRVASRATTTLDLSGLDNNVTYSVAMRGYNALYDSRPFETAVTSIPRGRPVAPAAAAAPVGDVAAIYVTWGAGTGRVLADIDAHIITATPSGGGTAITYDVSAAATSATLSGLTNGVEYTVTIRTLNRKLDGTTVLFESAATTLGTATPLGPPQLPATFTVDASDARVIVLWTPVSNGTVTGYNVRWSTSGNTSSYTYLNVTSASTATVDVSGVSNNQAYDFSIQSYNTNRAPNGTSLYFTPLRTVTPRGRPSAPTATGLVAGVGQVSVSWVGNGLAADIDNYVVRVSPATVGPFTVAKTVNGLDISGLTNGQAYSVYVAAVNNVFTSAEADAGSATPLAVPEQVTGMVVDPSNASIVVNWTAAAAAASTAVSGYKISYTVLAVEQILTVSGRATTSAVISGLSNNSTYSVKMKAVNAITEGAYNTAVAPVTPRAYPEPPTSVSAVAGDGFVDVSWVYTGSMTNIDNYTVVVTASGGSPVEYVYANNVRTFTLTGLTNGTEYTIGVYASNSNSVSGGTLFKSVTVSGGTVTPLGPPATPVLTGTATESKVTLNWTISGTANLDGFVVKQGGVDLQTVSAAARTTDISGLTNGVAYSFTIVAYNTNGTRSADSGTVTLTPRAIPLGVRDLSGLADISEAVVDWITATDGEHPTEDLDMFRIKLYTGATATGTPTEVIDLSGTSTARVKLIDISYNADPGTAFDRLVQINRLTNGTTYTMVVSTRNKNGDFSVDSSAVTVRPLAAPPVPTVTRLQAGNRTIDVEWTVAAGVYGASNLVYKAPVITASQVVGGGGS